MEESVAWDEVCPPAKSKKRKRWVIQYKYCGRLDFISKDWKTYKRYTTEKARDDALRRLSRGDRDPWLNRWKPMYKYRKGEDGSVHK